MATAKWYSKAVLRQHNGNAVDWTADTIKVALASSSYTPNQDTDDFFDDVEANEVTGTNWSAGGQTLANKTATYDAASNTVRLDADDISVATVTVTGARYAVIYKSTGTSSTSALLGWVDFGGDQSVTAATLAIQWDSTDGVLRCVVS
jgi:hypothetical protein